MALRFNPPPGWSNTPGGLEPETGWQPDSDWQPDPSWPPAPAGWLFWVSDEAPADPTEAAEAVSSPPAGSGGGAQQASAGAANWSLPGAAPPVHDQLPGAAPPVHDQLPGAAPPVHDQLPGAAPGAQPRPPSQTSQLATAAFVLGLLGFAVITAILAVVLGAVAVSRIRWSPRAGKALAIWGICLGAGWLVLLAVAIGIGAPVGFSFSSGTVSVPPGQPVPITSLVTGDCFDFPPAKGATFVDETPCNQPHNSQVFATFLASGSSSTYPGIASLTVLAARGCRARAGAVDGSKVSNSMSGRFMYPLADAWQAGGRTIKCVIYSPTSISSSVLTHQQQSRAQA